VHHKFEYIGKPKIVICEKKTGGVLKRRALLLLVTVLLVVAAMNAEVKKVKADKSGTTITYYLVHPLHKIEGVSKDAECTAEIDAAARAISSVTVAVDVTTFDSGNSNRDSHAMEVIDALEYPESTFTSTKVVERGDSLFATGSLTFHGITHDVTIAAKPEWSGSQVVVNGAFDILLTDYKVERPSLMMIPVENTLRFTVTALFKL
jgi:polyisoprenoid-binding protein YceI